MLGEFKYPLSILFPIHIPPISTSSLPASAAAPVSGTPEKKRLIAISIY